MAEKVANSEDFLKDILLRLTTHQNSPKIQGRIKTMDVSYFQPLFRPQLYSFPPKQPLSQTSGPLPRRRVQKTTFKVHVPSSEPGHQATSPL